ncbi:MAG: ABC transporter permease [Meiothermus sp.]|uniref:ABC transporter permease n=1 Tax=Meiothermus sp. TaxID=1955249 RepID=UPI0025D5B4A4|nr:ABC transporter permease [Meiothermus sp.]MCS7057877.1 ABC transporter permease [Meiothermus sp.]MCS7194247.1 ABC transporter permease [Meiothermus sp.]MCX7740463.1 ABC transporter permease [Meiothermus sp.]MDW8090819.1 ABC transporter permease [Meiothermus sp.]MDW8480759.1 ABC transporter permease [Meiothermus sp.]
MQPSLKGRREGSPWVGLWAVFFKEMADHLSSTRMRILEVLILFSAVGAVYAGAQTLRQTVSEDPFLLLRVFTAAQDPLPSFVAFLSFFLPLAAIALGFDAINGEYNRNTLSRVLAQPIYRDALLWGKFLAGLATLALILLALFLLVVGLSLIFLGVPPDGEEVGRALLFLLATLAYAGVWLGIALVCSVLFRSAATSALAAIAVWLFFALFWGIIAQLLAQAVAPYDPFNPESELRQAEALLAFSRVSPNTLYAEAIQAILNPGVRSLGPVLISQLQGALLGSPLPLGQSLLLAWPQLTGLIALTLLLFALAYVLFQRREVRA